MVYGVGEKGASGSFVLGDPPIACHPRVGTGHPEAVELGRVEASVGTEFHRNGRRDRELVEQLDVDKSLGRNLDVQRVML